MYFCKNNRLSLFFVSNPVVGTTSKSSTRALKRWYFRLIWTKLSDVRACLKFRLGTAQIMPKSYPICCDGALRWATNHAFLSKSHFFIKISLFSSKSRFFRENLVLFVKITFFSSKSRFFRQNRVWGGQIHPKLRFPLFFDDLELIGGIPGIRGIRGSCPSATVRDLPSTCAGGLDEKTVIL